MEMSVSEKTHGLSDIRNTTNTKSFNGVQKASAIWLRNMYGDKKQLP